MPDDFKPLKLQLTLNCLRPEIRDVPQFLLGAVRCRPSSVIIQDGYDEAFSIQGNRCAGASNSTYPPYEGHLSGALTCVVIHLQGASLYWWAVGERSSVGHPTLQGRHTPINR